MNEAYTDTWLTWTPYSENPFNFTGLSFDDVLLRPQKSPLATRADADTSVEFLGRKLGVPFLSAPMPSVTGSSLANRLDKLGGLPVLHRFGSIGNQRAESAYSGAFCAAAIGIHDGIERTRTLYTEGDVDIFVLDVAHAHSDPVIEFVKKWKRVMPEELKLVAGNVATGEGARDLVDAGADAIKVGIGPGSVCTTRQVTGFGVPQLDAINEVKAWLSYYKSVPIIADGGIRNSGDIVKALAAGADVVMIGSLFANAIEAPNDGIHYGCASDRLTVDNVEGTTKSTGEKRPLADIVKELADGLRSGISYGGARNIDELRKNAQWVKLTDAGRKESKL